VRRGGKSGRVEVTGLYRQLYEAAGDIKPKNISIDTLSRAFAGNEIDRVQVYAFAMHMQALAMVAGGAVTVLSHPSLAGIASGSGSRARPPGTAHSASASISKVPRPPMASSLENDLRELGIQEKPIRAIGETVALRYQRGLFLPEAGISNLDKLAREARAEEYSSICWGDFPPRPQRGRQTNFPELPPAAFAKEADAKKDNFRKPDLDAAMRRLFDANKSMSRPTADQPDRLEACDETRRQNDD